MGFHRVLVALDRSLYSEAVFDKALAIAKQDGAALMLFHCLPFENPGITPYGNIYGEELVSFSQVILDNIEREADEVKQWLADYCQRATEQGVKTEWDWKIGQAGSWIREIAQDWNADLIVVGRRGRRGLAEMFLGSVSNYIIHHASCSVLVVQ